MSDKLYRILLFLAALAEPEVLERLVSIGHKGVDNASTHHGYRQGGEEEKDSIEFVAHRSFTLIAPFVILNGVKNPAEGSG